jgi:hypothetical protein
MKIKCTASDADFGPLKPARVSIFVRLHLLSLTQLEHFNFHLSIKIKTQTSRRQYYEASL